MGVIESGTPRAICSSFEEGTPRDAKGIGRLGGRRT